MITRLADVADSSPEAAGHVTDRDGCDAGVQEALVVCTAQKSEASLLLVAYW